LLKNYKKNKIFSILKITYESPTKTQNNKLIINEYHRSQQFSAVQIQDKKIRNDVHVRGRLQDGGSGV